MGGRDGKNGRKQDALERGRDESREEGREEEIAFDEIVMYVARCIRMSYLLKVASFHRKVAPEWK